MSLRALDLNLLVALDALLREGSVTKAAKTVGLSQPAMSNALSRLRTALGDPLLVRTPSGMRPTPRAAALAGPLAAALKLVEETVLQPRPFDPRTEVRTFTVASADYEQLVLLPPLMERLAKLAPGIRLHVSTPRDRLPTKDLADGELDLALAIHSEVRAGIYRTPLLEDRFVCALADKHPDAKAGRLTLARYTALDHLLISPFGGMTGSVDEALERLGLARTVKLAVPSFALAPFILARTPYVLTLPERAARLFATHLPLKLVKPPLELQGFSEALYWHERQHQDPAHKWLRQLLREVAAAVK